MSGTEMRRSFKLTRFGGPLEEVQEAPPSPSGTEVLLRVDACGVCHSDCHIADGYFDLGHGQKFDLSRGLKLPHVLGHEIVGTVAAVGPDAEGVAIGDRRVIYPWLGCGDCLHCRTGAEHLCSRPRAHGVDVDGGFSSAVLVRHPRYLLEFDPLPETFAATLACSGLTAFSALKKAQPFDAQNPLLVIGAGGLGLAATRIAQAVHGVAPVVADIDPAKRQAALEAGAASAFDPGDADATKRAIREAGRFAAAIDFVGATSTAQLGLGALNKGGRLIVVGLFGGSLDIPLPTIPIRSVSVIGSYVGSLAEFGELIAIARAGKIEAMPIETRPLEAAQQSLDDLRQGKIKGRAVLKP